MTLLEKWPEKIQALNGVRNHDLCVADTLLALFNCCCWTSTTMEFLSRIQTRPLSCGFDSSVGRALHQERKRRGFKSCSKPEFFLDHFSSRLFQALCQWRIEKAGGRRVGSGREKGEVTEREPGTGYFSSSVMAAFASFILSTFTYIKEQCITLLTNYYQSNFKGAMSREFWCFR